MEKAESPRLVMLRMLLVLDATLLLVLGAVFLLMPAHVQQAFHFHDLPPGVNYLMGLWGCALATLALGYAIAAANPARNVAWVQVGIARGALECLFGAVCLSRGLVTWQQAGFGTLVAAAIMIAYIVLYPAKEQA